MCLCIQYVHIKWSDHLRHLLKVRWKQRTTFIEVDSYTKVKSTMQTYTSKIIFPCFFIRKILRICWYMKVLSFAFNRFYWNSVRFLWVNCICFCLFNIKWQLIERNWLPWLCKLYIHSSEFIRQYFPFIRIHANQLVKISIIL